MVLGIEVGSSNEISTIEEFGFSSSWSSIVLILKLPFFWPGKLVFLDLSMG